MKALRRLIEIPRNTDKTETFCIKKAAAGFARAAVLLKIARQLLFAPRFVIIVYLLRDVLVRNIRRVYFLKLVEGFFGLAHFFIRRGKLVYDFLFGVSHNFCLLLGDFKLVNSQVVLLAEYERAAKPEQRLRANLGVAAAESWELHNCVVELSRPRTAAAHKYSGS